MVTSAPSPAPETPGLPDYAELHCLSNFTFLRGASHPEELVARARDLGYRALAITDECSFAGSARAHLAARALGADFHLIHGTEVTLADGLRLVFLACNRAGYGNLSALVTLGRRRAEKGRYHLTRGDLGPVGPQGALPDCLVLWLPGPAAGGGASAEGRGDGLAGSGVPYPLEKGVNAGAAVGETEASPGPGATPGRGEEGDRAAQKSGRGPGLQAGAPGDCLPPLSGGWSARAPGGAQRFPGVGTPEVWGDWVRPGPTAGADPGGEGEEACSASASASATSDSDSDSDSEPNRPLPWNPADGRWLARRFPGRVWIGVELHAGPDDRGRLESLTALGAACGLPLVAAGDVHMHLRSRRPLQDVLTALRLKTTVFAAGHALFPNGERHLRSRLRLARVYPPALLAETLAVAARCTFSLDELRYEYPDEVVPPGLTPAAYLAAEVEAGLERRYPAGTPAPVRERIAHELALIGELRYEPYFLTVYEIVRFARSRGILCQGRGSAANSAVCYALGITEVDPAQSELLFERFVSKERGEPPDIDVDFEHQRREEVIQHIYEKYGRDRAALAAALITYRTRGALRDAGRVLGFGREQIDALAGTLAWWDRRDQLPERLRSVGLDPDSPRVAKWLAVTEALIGFPRHLTQHVGGFVISRGPLSRLVPIENAAMAGRSVIQWDKDDIDALGLMKVDVLALGMLSAIRRSLDLITARLGRPFAMQQIPREEPRVYQMLCQGDSMGVFQVESRAQMAMLPRLRPQRFYDLVVEVAIVRPGPIQGDMVHPYLKRRHGREPIERVSEAVDRVLERTCGVPIFQEQVMQLAVVAAGFTPGEADQLRRAMAAWKRKGGLEPFQAKLIQGMAAHGLPQSFAQRIYAQIQGFGEYGFPESHAASFALLVYVSAWLKRFAPAAFYCGLLNSQPMGFYSPSQLVQDARRHGVTVLPPEVTVSDWDSTLEDQDGSPPPGRFGKPALRLGLGRIAGLSQTGAERLLAARRERPFAHLADLAARSGLDRRDLEALAAANALARLLGGGEGRADGAEEGTRVRGRDGEPDKEQGRAWDGERDWGLGGARDGERNEVRNGGQDKTQAGELPAERRGAGFPLAGAGAPGNGGTSGSKASAAPAAWSGFSAPEFALTPPQKTASQPQGTDFFLNAQGTGKNDGLLHAGTTQMPENRPSPEGRPATHRRQAAWAVAALEEASGRGSRAGQGIQGDLFAGLAPAEAPVTLSAPTEGENLVADYTSLGLTLGRHPLALLRTALSARRFVTAAQLWAAPDRKLLRGAGIVTNRQRPGTASGIVFLTLEDETGNVNVVVKPELVEKQRRELLGARLLGVYGVLESREGTAHLLAKRLVDLTPLLGRLPTSSRDFH